MTTNQKVITILILIIGMLLWAVAVVKWEDSRIDPYKDYLTPIFTENQVDQIIQISDQTRDKNHFIARFWAICSHEQWNKTFVDWKSKYLCWRLKKDMIYKDFNTQLQWRVDTYNKYRYKNTTVDWRLLRSKYCVSDTHWWWAWCPNRRDNIPVILSRATFYNNQVKNKDNQIITNKNLPKPTKICRKVGTIQKDEYLQIDNKRGQFKLRLRELWIWDKVFICKDL